MLISRYAAGVRLALAGMVLVLIELAPTPLSADTYPRQPGITITGYTFDITLSDASDEFVVADTIEVQFVAPGVTTIELDLCKFSDKPRSGTLASGFADPCAEPSGGRDGAATSPKGGKGMTVTGVSTSGQPLMFQHENDRVRVAVPRPFESGERWSFTVEEACAAATSRCSTDGKDLTWLFTQLLNRGGALQVQATWSYDAASKQVQVRLEQTQTTGLYRMPIELLATTAAPAADGRGGAAGAAPQPGRTIHLMQLTQRRQSFTFPSETEPTSVVLDPNAWVVMRATIEKR